MAPRGTSSRNGALGRAEFMIREEEETLAVQLDRQGFRRLLRTLEALAKSGNQQGFEQSGWQDTPDKGNGSAGPKVTRLTFSIDEAPDR